MQQITKTLPASAWQGIEIKECGEPLVELVETSRLRLGLVQKGYKPRFLVRKGLAERLIRAIEYLPNHWGLVVVEGWRSMEHQKHSWDTKWSIFKKEHPDWTDEEIDKSVRLIVARPNPLANHHCGGAVDVVLIDVRTGKLVEMGTPYPYDQMPASITRLFPMHHSDVEPLARENRRILREAMQAIGCVYFPHEWWHYCWNDRMWAVYTNQKECGYGPVEP